MKTTAKTNGFLTLAGFVMTTACVGVAHSNGAVITTQPAPAISDPASVFNANNSGGTYTAGQGTNFIPAGFDARDLFGGNFGTFGPEQGVLLFNDDQAKGTVESINVTLPTAVSLSGYNLFLKDDGPNGERSASEFRLLADGVMISDVLLLDTTGTQSYTGVYGGSELMISDTFSAIPAESNFTLQFVQNQDSGRTSGLRAIDFTAIGTSAVPEPASISGVVVGLLMLSRRRNRN